MRNYATQNAFAAIDGQPPMRIVRAPTVYRSTGKFFATGLDL
jgi:hypothetical protein